MRVDDLDVPEGVKEILRKDGIEELYPPQVDAIKAGALSGENLVLASPTASGKTLIAFLCAAKHVLEESGKVLYLCPLRALATEKYREFCKLTLLRKLDGTPVKVALSTGDFDSSDPWLAEYDIIVTTNEKADSLIRHGARWMSAISLVVADEVHLLGSLDRGPTLELLLTKLRKICPNAQFLALSATIRNAEEIASWLGAKCISTQWRPVPLWEGIFLRDAIEYSNGKVEEVEIRSHYPLLDVVRSTIEEGGQALVFVSTRRRAVSTAKKLASLTRKFLDRGRQAELSELARRIHNTEPKTKLSDTLATLVCFGAAFHHAGLAYAHRTLVEDAFREGKILALAATPTLAAGVNLPARMVVIADHMRYDPYYATYSPISTMEYKQMSGRAGRPKYDKIGKSVLMCKTEELKQHLLERYILAKPERILSQLAREDVMRFHALAIIACGFARSRKGLVNFLSKSLFAHQFGKGVMERELDKALDFLEREGFITVTDSRMYATRLGKRTSELYIDPLSAVIIRDSLREAGSLEGEVGIFSVICRTNDMAPLFRPKGRRDEENVEAFIADHEEEFLVPIPELDSFEYERFLAEVKTLMVLQAWVNELSEDDIMAEYGVQPGDLYRLVMNAEWLLYASLELCKVFRWLHLLTPLRKMQLRVRHGVREELLPLVRLPGVGRARARALYEAGYRVPADLKTASLEEIARVPGVGIETAKKIKQYLSGERKKVEEKREAVVEEPIPVQRKLTEYLV